MVLPFLAVGMGALLAVVALVVDLGRLMLVRSELQAAADACALSAVHELNQTVGQLQRAQMSGQHAASMVPRAFQSALTRTASDGATTVTFSTDGTNYVAASESAAAHRFARCTVEHTGLGSFIGRSTGAAVGGVISATATATGRPASRACVVPLALERPTATANRDYGFVRGRVYYLADPTLSLSTGLLTGNLLTASVSASNYRLRFVDTTPSQNASITQLIDMVASGICDVEAGQIGNRKVIQLVNHTSADARAFWDAWNSRFGLYDPSLKKTRLPTDTTTGVLPDLTGWAPDPPALRFPDGNLLTDVIRVLGSVGTLTRVTPESSQFARYGQAVDSRSAAPNSSRPVNYSPEPSSGNHLAWGASNRRLVVLPVTDTTSPTSQSTAITDWACVLMYRPAGETTVPIRIDLLSLRLGPIEIKVPLQTVNVTFPVSVPVEFLGFANAPDSPCRTAGMPGPAGARGPLVPALLQ